MCPQQCVLVCQGLNVAYARDKQIGFSLRGRPILFSLVWLQTEFELRPTTITYVIKKI